MVNLGAIGSITFLFMAQILSHSMKTTERDEPCAIMNIFNASTVRPRLKTPRTKKGHRLDSYNLINFIQAMKLDVMNFDGMRNLGGVRGTILCYIGTSFCEFEVASCRTCTS